jgi:hypothetical protein
VASTPLALTPGSGPHASPATGPNEPNQLNVSPLFHLRMETDAIENQDVGADNIKIGLREIGWDGMD